MLKKPSKSNGIFKSTVPESPGWPRVLFRQQSFQMILGMSQDEVPPTDPQELNKNSLFKKIGHKILRRTYFGEDNPSSTSRTETFDVTRLEKYKRTIPDLFEDSK